MKDEFVNNSEASYQPKEVLCSLISQTVFLSLLHISEHYIYEHFSAHRKANSWFFFFFFLFHKMELGNLKENIESKKRQYHNMDLQGSLTQEV